MDYILALKPSCLTEQCTLNKIMLKSKQSKSSYGINVKRGEHGEERLRCNI